MSRKIAIRVERLSKYYKLGTIGGHTLQEDLARWWAHLRGKPNPLLKLGSEDHGNRDAIQLWALRDVSFEVGEGDILGVIGHNGAGKSTLLKILSRITAPSTGRAVINGRVGSLLEVGTGFHPELTGRENIYLNGAILGMTRSEIKRKLDDIIDFAEMSRFIDTPVKRYSSGMSVRLAFSVAAHLEPEILIIDEVLAVGDVKFQERCIGKMRNVAREGRTILFVSHNLPAIQAICSSAMLFARGEIVASGDCASVVSKYRSHASEGQGHVRFDSQCIQLHNVSAKYATAGVVSAIEIEIELTPTEDLDGLTIDLGIENRNDIRVLQVMPLARGRRPIEVARSERIRIVYKLRAGAMASGEYLGTLYLHDRKQNCLLHQTHMPLFSVPGHLGVPETLSQHFTAVMLCDFNIEVSGSLVQ